MSRRILKAAALLLIVILMLPLSGCWDRRELEDMSFVLVLGVDEIPGGNVKVTLVIARPATIGGRGEEGGRPYLVLDAIAPSIVEALDVANSYSARRLTLIHANAIVIGRETAEKGLGFLDGLARLREWRGTAGFLIAEGKASELLSQLSSDIEPNPGKLFQGAMSMYEYTGFIPRENTFLVQRRFSSMGAEAVAILVGIREKGELAPEPAGKLEAGDYTAGELPRDVNANPVEFHGLAVFSEDRMVGTLTGVETTAYNLIRGEFKAGYYSPPDPYNPELVVPVQLRLARQPEIKISWPERYRPRIKVNLELEADIATIQNTDIDYTKPEHTKALEEAIARAVKEDCEQTIAKLQGMQADVLGFALKMRSHFATTAELEQLNWREVFPKTEISVNVTASIRRIGLQDTPLKPR